ncbi:MAG: FAD:protein FMN transferase [Chthoniobacteraceae bacterium]
MFRVLLFISLAASLHADDALQRFAYEKAEMGLPFRITLYAPDAAAAKAAADAAFERIAQLNGVFSDYDSDSELSRLSRTSGTDRFVPVTTDLWNVLERAQALALRTDGAFDITIGPLVSLWRRARQKKELPGADIIAEMKERVGWHNLLLDPATKSAKLLVPDMRLDVAAIAKGYAIDAAAKLLRERGVTRSLVAGGGDMMAGDPPPGQPGWKIEVAPLDAPDSPAAEVVLLRNSAIATSGDIFQRVEIGGVRYSHIVDQQTGLGLTDHSLVTILAPDCTTADSLSTAVSALRPRLGLKLVEETPGIAARIVRKPADRVEVRTSARWPEQAR